MSANPPDPRGEFRGQRHEFILQYYNMAVQDLTRHLQIGWQTIATVAGAIATLSAGQQGYLPIPIAALSAILICLWGVDNVIDANYWATRAIAFLSNVEAHYFYITDRRHFNPYAGGHPPYQLMDSLKSQFYAVLGITFVAVLFYLQHIAQRSDNFNLLRTAAATTSPFKAFLWLSPAFALLYLINRAVSQWKKRLDDYLSFVTESPGPGMVNDPGTFRSLAPAEAGVPAAPVTGAEQLQRRLREQLTRRKRRWDRAYPVINVLSAFVALALLLVVYF